MLKKINNKGFTIIEVLIVLAIAGVIMLVVFLAVPSLQRNSRNTQRTNDVALVSAAVNECLTNRNGTVASCDTQAEVVAAGTLDTTKIRQFDLGTTAYGTASFTGSAPADTMAVVFAAKCDDAGVALVTGQPSRQFAVLYEIETTSGFTLRCQAG
jgi:prepilin-type N-terminal cleavage/methylation domain-containing protein